MESVAGGEPLGGRVVGRGRGPTGTPDGPGTTPAPPPAAEVGHVAAAVAVLGAHPLIQVCAVVAACHARALAFSLSFFFSLSLSLSAFFSLSFLSF